LLNSNQTRRPATDYLYQTNKLFGNFLYQKTLSSSPIVDLYQDANEQMYMLVSPTQTGHTTTYSLNMGSADSAYVYNPAAGANDMTVNKVKLNNGTLSVNVTETPIFIVPSGSTALTLNTVKTATALTANAATSLNTINVYPNPTAKLATVAFTNTSTAPVTIKVTDVNMNKTYKTYSFAKSGESFSNTIDVSNVPMGVCIIQVLQGDQSIMRKVIKTM
jgi:endoglucanase